MSKPTPRPWIIGIQVNEKYAITGAQVGEPLKMVGLVGNKANAQHIIDCVHRCDLPVTKAAERMRELLEEVYHKFGDDHPTMHQVANLLAAIAAEEGKDEWVGASKNVKSVAKMSVSYADALLAALSTAANDTQGEMDAKGAFWKCPDCGQFNRPSVFKCEHAGCAYEEK